MEYDVASTVEFKVAVGVGELIAVGVPVISSIATVALGIGDGVVEICAMGAVVETGVISLSDTTVSWSVTSATEVDLCSIAVQLTSKILVRNTTTINTLLTMAINFVFLFITYSSFHPTQPGGGAPVLH